MYNNNKYLDYRQYWGVEFPRCQLRKTLILDSLPYNCPLLCDNLFKALERMQRQAYTELGDNFILLLHLKKYQVCYRCSTNLLSNQYIKNLRQVNNKHRRNVHTSGVKRSEKVKRTTRTSAPVVVPRKQYQSLKRNKQHG